MRNLILCLALLAARAFTFVLPPCRRRGPPPRRARYR